MSLFGLMFLFQYGPTMLIYLSHAVLWQSSYDNVISANANKVYAVPYSGLTVVAQNLHIRV